MGTPKHLHGLTFLLVNTLGFCGEPRKVGGFRLELDEISVREESGWRSHQPAVVNELIRSLPDCYGRTTLKGPSVLAAELQAWRGRQGPFEQRQEHRLCNVGALSKHKVLLPCWIAQVLGHRRYLFMYEPPSELRASRFIRNWPLAPKGCAAWKTMAPHTIFPSVWGISIWGSSQDW